MGLGGLGSPVALYLAAAGVGQLVLADDDRVDLSNLQRQIAHDQASLGELKTASAARRIAALNPDTKLELHSSRLEGDTLSRAIAGVDLVIDGTDNFVTRYAINDACFAAGVPLISGAAIRMEGQVAVFDPRHDESPCYRCLYPAAAETELNCAENGVAAPLVGIIGSIQAMEALKLLAQIGQPLRGFVLYLDAASMDWHKLRLKRRPDCAMHRQSN
ncbi:MAG: molybdopterin-synthase adenylyltransferase MoeB [Gammaproteobacteria bacterium]|nr:molybdopterin-synthase adenylyltransferase MoeB [Gammaproteobacteria bacterium]